MRLFAFIYLPQSLRICLFDLPFAAARPTPGLFQLPSCWAREAPRGFEEGQLHIRAFEGSELE